MTSEQDDSTNLAKQASRRGDIGSSSEDDPGKRGSNLGWWVLAAAALGVALALMFGDSNALDATLGLGKTLFLAALKAIIAPLIFFSLLSGLLNLSGTARLSRLGGLTVSYYFVTTAIAVVIGLTVVLVIHPWTAWPPMDVPAIDPGRLISTSDGSLSTGLTGLMQAMLTNPFAALAETNLLGIVVTSVIIGLAALLTLPTDSPVIAFVHDAAKVTYKVAGWAVMLIPIGVVGIAYDLTLSADSTLLGQLLAFCAVVFGATAVHGLIVLPLVYFIATRSNPLPVMSAIASPMLVALTTSSSAATLPLSLITAREKLAIRPAVASFVLPLGATVNMDGTALFEGVAAVFLAYIFGIDLGLVGTLTVFLVAMLASIGAPGIPSGSMAGMQVVLLAVGIPLEAIGLLLLVERPLDTFRTSVNVEGDLFAAAFVEHRLRRDTDLV
ncbi:MAG: dicarboxylate/amino acid:cation symporter [Pseudomonadaceae bacterium]|nr:dicarboxylate/amino acid:cation symporter [Pseudomonadaceae bacterium]